MTVFGNVTARISPVLASYMRSKGKTWKDAFFASLQSMVGVEYIVYKRERCWQIRGEWDNIKRAHKVLHKLTTEAGYQTHVDEEESRMARGLDHTEGGGDRKAGRPGGEREAGRCQARTPARPAQRSTGRLCSLRPRAQLKPLPRQCYDDENSSDSYSESVNQTNTLSDCDDDVKDKVKKEPVYENQGGSAQTLQTEFGTEQYPTPVGHLITKSGPHFAADAVSALAATFAEENVIESSSCLSPAAKSNETIERVVGTESEVAMGDNGDSDGSKKRQTMQVSEIVPLNIKKGHLGRTSNRRKPQNPVKVEETAELSVTEDEDDIDDEDDFKLQSERRVNEMGTEHFEEVEQRGPREGVEGESSEEPDDGSDSDWDVETMVKQGRDSVKLKHRTFSCDLCVFTSRNRDSIRDHKKRNHMEKNLKCPECGKAYGVRRDLRKHIRTHTTRYPCEICGKIYKEGRNYRNHLKTHENNYIRPSWPCDQCDKSFSTKYVLQVHKEQIHQGHMPEWLCPVCGKNFKQKHSLVEHQLIHTGERPFACTICSKTFRHRTSCRKHEMLHADVRLFTCEVCGKHFKQRNSLKIHAVVHTRERNHRCSVCNKMFTQKQALIRHYRIHSGEKPFMCELCGDRFNDTSILRRHMMGIHKTELKSGIQHFVLPAGHYHNKQKSLEDWTRSNNPLLLQETVSKIENMDVKSTDLEVFPRKDFDKECLGNDDSERSHSVSGQGAQHGQDQIMSPLAQTGASDGFVCGSTNSTSPMRMAPQCHRGQASPPQSTAQSVMLPPIGAVAFPGLNSDLQSSRSCVSSVMSSSSIPYLNINAPPNPTENLSYLQSSQPMSAYNYQRLY